MPKVKRQSLDHRRRLAKHRMRKVRQKSKSNSESMAGTDSDEQPQISRDKNENRQLEEHQNRSPLNANRIEVRKKQPNMYRVEQRKEYRTLYGQEFEIVQLYMFQLLAPTL